jgi:hypothetical protein
MFERINVSFEPEEILPFMSPIYSAMYGECFIEYPTTNQQELMKIVSRKLSFGIMPTHVMFVKMLSPGVVPHCDICSLALVVYLNADDGDITRFYSSSSEDDDTVIVKSYYGYHEGKYTEIKSNLTKSVDFSARVGECVLLNTQIPHDVSMMKDNSTRIMLRMTWEKEKFDDVVNRIKVL